jgi:RNA polymerase sigma-70 factor (ECF subfamily)
MDPKRDRESRDDSATLGDLLYGDRSTSSPSEDEWLRLLESIAGGDQQALRALYERAHRLVFTLAVRICGSHELAEEVTLDVFHDVWQRAAGHNPTGGSVVGWIMMQARSRAIDRLRFEHRKKRMAPAYPNNRDEPVQGGQPGDFLEARQRSRRLQDALSGLTADEREAVETAFFSELTYPETAARLDQPLGTVKTRVRCALAKLRKALESEEDSS